MERNHWLLIASIAGATGVMAGAFGAHGLKDKVSTEMLAIFETGARYQLLHALALLGIAALSSTWNNRTLNLAGWAFTLGILIFSGSLYLLVLTSARWWGAVTPIGGVALIVGWVILGVAGMRRGNRCV